MRYSCIPSLESDGCEFLNFGWYDTSVARTELAIADHKEKEYSDSKRHTAAMVAGEVSGAAIEDEAALLSRLQSQFGDMDITNLLNQNEEKKVGDDDGSEESSLKEPTPEELKAWQEAQFQKGLKELELLKRQTMTPLQKRRTDSKKKKKDFADVDGDDDDWEQVAALPDLDGQASTFFPNCDSKGNEFLGVHPLLQELTSKGDPDILGTKWKRLYSSDAGDGLSFPTLLNTLKGYNGPTVMLIGCIPSASHVLPNTTNSIQATEVKKSTTIGVFTTSPWIESVDFFGAGNECFLFAFDEQQHDDVKFFRPKQQNQEQEEEQLPHEKNSCETNYMYCHPASLTMSNRRTTKAKKGTATDGHVHGIGVGGTTSQPRLHLTETLEECRAMDYDPIFESGDLLLGNCNNSLFYFDVDCLEIWGVGGQDWIAQSLLEQQKERDIAIANLQRTLKVDKKQFLDDFRAGRFLGKTNPLFEHNAHSMNRTDL